MDSTTLHPDPIARRDSRPAGQSEALSGQGASASSAADRQGFLSALDKAARGREQASSADSADDGATQVRERLGSAVPESDRPFSSNDGLQAYASDADEYSEIDRSGVRQDGDGVDESRTAPDADVQRGSAPPVPSGSAGIVGHLAVEGQSAVHVPEIQLTMASSSALAGPAGSESLSTLLRQRVGGSLAGQAMAFEVVGGEHGINAMQLTPGANGWRLTLAVERNGSDVLRHHAGTLQASLAGSGQTVSDVQFVEGMFDE